jgi:mono/diheme cytochrome c family protein
MKIFRILFSSPGGFQLGAGLVLMTLGLCFLAGPPARADDTKAKKEATPPKESAPPPKKAEKKAAKKLNGADLYAVHCNRCHPERYAPERTAEQWKTILLHMRTRANLPAAQARAILQYLQEDSGK